MSEEFKVVCRRKKVPTTSSSDPHLVKDVWMPNAREEIKSMCKSIQKYNHVSVVVKHLGNIGQSPETIRKEIVHDYGTVKENVNRLPVVQVAFTLFDAHGKVTNANCVTLHFNMKLDEQSQPITDNMAGTGFDFKEHREFGIEYDLFAELLKANRIVLNKHFVWLGYNAMYDYAHLVRILTAQPLPDDECKFRAEFDGFFHNMYDVRYLMSARKNLHGPLDRIANRFDIKRVGARNCAGSDSKLIGRIFFRIKGHYFENSIDDIHIGHIYNVTNPNDSVTTCYKANKKTAPPRIVLQ